MKNDLIELIHVKVDILNILKDYKNNINVSNSHQLDINIIPNLFFMNLLMFVRKIKASKNKTWLVLLCTSLF